MNTKTTSTALAILVGIAQIAVLSGHAGTYEPRPRGRVLQGDARRRAEARVLLLDARVRKPALSRDPRRQAVVCGAHAGGMEPPRQSAAAQGARRQLRGGHHLARWRVGLSVRAPLLDRISRLALQRIEGEGHRRRKRPLGQGDAIYMAVFAKDIDEVKIPGLKDAKGVSMLGSATKVDWSAKDGALEIRFPKFMPGAAPVEFAPVFKIAL